MYINKIKLKILVSFGILVCFGLFLYVGISFATGTTVTLSSPDGTSYNLGDAMTFNGTVDTGGSSATDVSLIVKDPDGNDMIQQTKTQYFLTGDGNTISADYLNQYNPVSGNPTTVVDQLGATCGTAQSPCNLFSSTLSPPNWNPSISGLTSIWMEMTLDHTFQISSVVLDQNTSFYAKHLKLETSTDNIGWTTVSDSVVVANSTVNFTPTIAKYLKFTFSDFSGVALYINDIDVRGQLTIPAPYTGTIPVSFTTTNNFNGGLNNWNIRLNNNGSYTYAPINKTFISNATSIDFSSSAPPNNSTQGHSVIGSVITSAFNYMNLWNVGNSLKTLFSFNDANNTNYGTVGTLSNLHAKCLPGNSGQVGDCVDGVKINGLSSILSGNFTLAFSWKYPSGGVIDGTDIITSSDGTNGITFRKYQSSPNDGIGVLIYNNGLKGANVANYSHLDVTQWVRFAISIDRTNNKVSFFENGHYLGEQALGYNTFTPQDYLTFQYKSPVNLFDEIVVLNKYVSQVEGESLTKITNNDMDLSNYSFNTTFQGLAVDQNGNYDKTETRQIHNIQQPNVSSCYSYDKTSKVHYYICTLQQNDTTPDNINMDYEYSLDNSTWTNAPAVYQSYSDKTFAVIGDSMSNGTEDWYGPFITDMGITQADIPTYAVKGNTCPQVRAELSSVANNTTDLFVTCGVNGFLSTDNTAIWQGIYDDAKAKGISRIHMTTMPPWDYINDSLDNASAITACQKMHTENDWLKNTFAPAHSDVTVSDVWTYFHDTSGTQTTDCGWRKDVSYSDDGVHPNSTLGASYWANKVWTDAFNQLKKGTKYALLNLPRSIEQKTLYVKATPSYSGVTGDTNTFSPLLIPGITTQQECTSEGYSWYNSVCNYNPDTPIASVSAGSYTTTQSITLTANGSTSIRYSTTGNPTSCTDGTLYTDQIPVPSTETIYAIACNSFGNSSSANFPYSINITSGHKSSSQKIIPKLIQTTVVQTSIPSVAPVFSTFEVQKITKNLKQGTVGKDVKTLQSFLIEQDKGPSAKALAKNGITNNFGKLTKTALMEWQKANGLKPDGVLGAKTRAKIQALSL